LSADEHAPDCRLGVLAFGDSITNGGGELQWGVALQSWALWVARGLGLPYTGMAEDGAVVADVVQRQMPALERGPAGRSARYDLGCLYIGVNDVRSPDWDAAEFEHHFQTALEYLRTRCDHVLTVTAPLDLGRPRAGAKVAEMNRVIERMASQVGALVLDLSRFGARNHVMTEHVHPTAFGQVAIAERALDVLAADGLAVVVRPAWLLRYETTWWTRLRADAAYGYRHLKVSLRAGARAAWLRLRGV
jgi:lysophospholipase L1-like esterase